MAPDERGVSIKLRFPAKTLTRLRATAERKNVSMAKLVRQLIDA